MNIRQTILEAAAALLSAGEDLQVRPLARKAGVSVGTVYNAFPTIDHLILALAAECWNSVAGVIRDACSKEEVPVQAVQSALLKWSAEPENVSFLQSLNRHPAMHRIFPASSEPAQALRAIQLAIESCLSAHHKELDHDTVKRMAISYTLLFRFLQSGLGEQMPLAENEEDRLPLIMKAFEELVGYVNLGIECAYRLKLS